MFIPQPNEDNNFFSNMECHLSDSCYFPHPMLSKKQFFKDITMNIVTYSTPIYKAKYKSYTNRHATSNYFYLTNTCCHDIDPFSLSSFFCIFLIWFLWLGPGIMDPIGVCRVICIKKVENPSYSHKKFPHIMAWRRLSPTIMGFVLIIMSITMIRKSIITVIILN